jgi:SecD/SecF fusion protein
LKCNRHLIDGFFIDPMRNIVFTLLACLALFISCNSLRPKGDCTYRAVLEVESSEKSHKEAITRTLEKRLDLSGFTKEEFTIQEKGSGLEVTLLNCDCKQELKYLRELCTRGGKLEFWETFDLSEVITVFTETNKQLANESAIDQNASRDTTGEAIPVMSRQDSVEMYKKENPLFAIFQVSTMYNESGQQVLGTGPIIGYANVKDTATIMSYFNRKESRSLMPRTLKLLWMSKPMEQAPEGIELVAIKMPRSGEAPLYGDIITDASIEKSEMGVSISFTMTPEAARAWAKMTRDNILKSIAIVVDDRVFSAPTVQGEITGGSCMITGDFTLAEAELLLAVLKSGYFPSPVRIAEESFK